MSAQSQPISAARFAAALPDLPLSSLHAKAAEIQNSVAHLKHSNSQLKQYAEEGDKDCQEAIDENLTVIKRQMERIELLKHEVEQRGFKWEETAAVNGTDDANVRPRVIIEDETSMDNSQEANPEAELPRGGSLGDNELARRLAEHMNRDHDHDDNDNDHDDGVHL